MSAITTLSFIHSPETIFSLDSKWYHLLLQPSQATSAVPSVGALSAVELVSGLRGAWGQGTPGLNREPGGEHRF